MSAQTSALLRFRKFANSDLFVTTCDPPVKQGRTQDSVQVSPGQVLRVCVFFFSSVENTFQ